ncbi:Uncharacterized membrane protein YczE [Alkalibacterium gilvum]|uniref:Uncharacterized membrane protein YczE n=2 Tax=Alkalibacterium gilvum TaxID=1130080 RepID=A0A1H6UV11_9LACT|nr:Uncharacterized membrane protein YczE [Alkalibacterium gilvum]
MEMKTILNYRGYALLTFFSATTAFAISFMLKASIGVSPFDASNQTLSFLSGIQVGTVSIIVNLFFVFGQFVLDRKNFGFRHFMQIPLSMLVGVLVNFFYYDLFESVEFNNYIESFIVFFLALTVVTFSVSVVTVLNLITNPIETFCVALTKHIRLNFPVLRQIVDIFFVSLSLALTFIFDLPATVREGTVITMLIFGPMMGVFIKYIYPALTKRGIIEEVKI